ncbi:MAG: 6-bladed beta-propeller, partial [Bacteroidales bacterium]|nr:6-bladed beta-propeller [Bacteroidales bacterium]
MKNRNLKLFKFICAAGLTVTLAACKHGKPAGDIDLKAAYPEKTLVLQEIAKAIEYVPLEPADSILMDDQALPIYVSEKRIVVADVNRGDIFVFKGDGRNIAAFNRKGQGPEEYDFIHSAVYDEAAGEIFVLTFRKFLVFSETGNYRRTLAFPEKSSNLHLFDFGGDTLLGYDRMSLFNDKMLEKPYLLLSKKDGQPVGELDISFAERYSNSVKSESGMFTAGGPGNWCFGKDFIISDYSSDTVFKLTRDKKITPLLVRTPSVRRNNPRIFLSPIFSTDKFIYFARFSIDYASIVEKNGIDMDRDVNYDNLWYDLATGESYGKVTLTNADSECMFYIESLASDEANT